MATLDAGKASDQPHQAEVITRTDDIKVEETLNFSKFLLCEKVLEALNRCGFIRPSPIQSRALPLARCGLDMIIQAKSGTGKTLVFSIALLEQFEAALTFPQALILVPTREIAVQIVSVLQDLGKSFKRKLNVLLSLLG